MIRICFNRVDFEYDIRGLLTSFYPGEPIEKAPVITEEIPSQEDCASALKREAEEERDSQVQKAEEKTAPASMTEGKVRLESDAAQKAALETVGEETAPSDCTAEKKTLPERERGAKGKFVPERKLEHHPVPDRVLYVIYRPDGLETALWSENHLLRRPFAPSDVDDRKSYKIDLKKEVYRLLSQETGKELPWGTLTGIRPTKIAMGLMEEGAPDQEIVSYMREKYLTSPEKTALSLEIAKREKEILSRIDYQKGYSIYLGIPFCPTTCFYCSFTSYPLSRYQSRVDDYLSCLFREIDYTAEAFADRHLNTLYIGGGTPTTLTADQMDRLLSHLEEKLDFSHLLEFTVEAGRPDSITKEKLEAIRKHHVTRISINPQTMKQKTLDIIGRRHTVEQVKEIFHLARQMGFDNFNMDLILGHPDEGAEDVEHTMKEIALLRPDNLTVHSLAVKRASRLNRERDLYAGYRMESSDSLMKITEDGARAMGLSPYYLYRQKNMAGNLENVGYALPGREGIYNILIMEEKQSIVALGAGSTTKAVFPDGRIERADNVKDVDLYISQIDAMIDRKRKLFYGLHI